LAPARTYVLVVLRPVPVGSTQNHPLGRRKPKR
jgi:hypothetical protein